MFRQVNAYAGDPILSLMEDYQQDQRTNKINLSIGLYYDANGQVPHLASIITAQQRILLTNHNFIYLPMEGNQQYRQLTQHLLFGEEEEALQAERIATIQTLGGSGALKVGADFLKNYFSHAHVWISDPTWDNHHAIFEGAGFNVNYYPYYDQNTKNVNFSAMLETLKQLPAQTIVVLHPCCHNPTGADLTQAQWDSLCELFLERDLIAFLDIAYQGFGHGLEKDAYAIRLFARRGVATLISHSCSKNFSLYGERIGGLSVVCRTKEEAERVLGQLKAMVRRNYSSPPINGANMVATVLSDPQLKKTWQDEVETMRQRIITMRHLLVEALPGDNNTHYLQQHGMFSYTGFTTQQIAALREQFAIYLVGNGRICIAGLNENNIDYVANAFATIQA